MSCLVHLRFSPVMARIAVCLAALLVQTTLLPLAHACHDSALRGDHPGAARVGSAAAGHDAATCPLCATLAHGRTGIATVAVGAPALQAAFDVPSAAAAAWSDATA